MVLLQISSGTRCWYWLLSFGGDYHLLVCLLLFGNGYHLVLVVIIWCFCHHLVKYWFYLHRLQSFGAGNYYCKINEWFFVYWISLAPLNIKGENVSIQANRMPRRGRTTMSALVN